VFCVFSVVSAGMALWPMVGILCIFVCLFCVAVFWPVSFADVWLIVASWGRQYGPADMTLACDELTAAVSALRKGTSEDGKPLLSHPHSLIRLEVIHSTIVLTLALHF